MHDGFNILIVDDEPNIRSGLANGLMKEADVIATARDVHHALEIFDEGDYRLVSTAAPTRIRSLTEVAEDAEKDAIQAALAASDCHREQTAKALGVSVRTLHYKMSRYGLH
ncbi:response regulator transcription factor [Symmachiella macrocystis]|nr:helix-turn-helix domain-containing protein [Symmachiella macrocystis]